MADAKSIARTLIERYPRTLSEEMGIDLTQNTPAPLFQWLCGTLLLSARISSDLAVAAQKAMITEGWTTAEAMSETSWSARAKVLNEAGYARFDEKTASMLGELCDLIDEKYEGDLRGLRADADGDTENALSLLKDFKGIGDLGAAIFLREVQTAWDEFYPFADEKARDAAVKLDLPEEPEALAGLVDKSDFPTLVTAMIRADLNDETETAKDEA